MPYLRLFILSLILQMVCFMLLIKGEHATLLNMIGFSTVFTIVWYLIDRLFPSRNNATN